MHSRKVPPEGVCTRTPVASPTSSPPGGFVPRSRRAPKCRNDKRRDARRRVPMTPFGPEPWQPYEQPGAEGLNVKGSSLPNCSGVPFCRNLSLRAFDRWQAPRIICGVAELGFGLTAVVDVVGALVVVVVV